MSHATIPPRSHLLLELVLIFLTPMFLYVADGDLPRARQAAVETLNAYGARSLLGMVIAAAEFTAGLDKLPEPERAKEMMRIRILTDSASALVAGTAPPAGDPAG